MGKGVVVFDGESRRKKGVSGGTVVEVAGDCVEFLNSIGRSPI